MAKQKFDRKEYQRQYYLKRKTTKAPPTSNIRIELIGCLISYLLFIMISISAIQQFTVGLNTRETWLFFFSVEMLIFLLSFTLSNYEGKDKYLRLGVIVLLTIGLNLLISKGSYDRYIELKTEKTSNQTLKNTIKQMDSSILEFQQRQMHSKAVDILKEKTEILKRIDQTNGQTISPENQLIMIVMRFFISLLNISVIKRIGQIMSGFLRSS